MADPITQYLNILQPRAFLWKEMLLEKQHKKDFSKHDGIVFGSVVNGACKLRLPDGQTLGVKPGDFVMLNAPGHWSMEVDDKGASQSDPLFGVCQQSHLGILGQKTCLVLAGHFDFIYADVGLQTLLLPRVSHFTENQMARTRLRLILDLIVEEASADLAGGEWVKCRLLELMLTHVLRLQSNFSRTLSSGALCAMADPRIGPCLKLLHNDFGKPWTVQSLAALAGMSRSVFAKNFRRLVGIPPVEYLTYWRMTLAKRDLVHTDRTLQQIACSVGYQSATSFGTAFKSVVGKTPAAYRSLMKRWSSPDIPGGEIGS
jgi:AraC-like DNA-binding protein